MARGKDYNILEDLTRIIGPSGCEEKVQKYFSKIMSQYVDEIEEDRLGNCFAKIEGDAELPHLMVNAHADSVGFQVKYIDDLGFVFTQDISVYNSIDYRMLPGTDVLILGRKRGNKKEKIVPGHFCSDKHIHLLSEEELEESVEREELCIDIGARSREQAMHYISLGDYVILVSDCRYGGLNGNSRFIGTNLDNRAGLFCLYRTAKAIDKWNKIGCPITFVSTTTEEGGYGAAAAAAHHVRPDIAITIDVTYATDQIRENNEDAIAKMYGVHHLDKGPVLGRGLGVDNDIFDYFESICHEKGIPYQVEVGSDGTENTEIQVAREGTQTGLISIATRNLHTRVEDLSLNDLENTIKILVESYKDISEGGLE